MSHKLTKPLRMQVYALLREQRQIALRGKSLIFDIESIDHQISAIEEEMYWINFIEYCNASVWCWPVKHVRCFLCADAQLFFYKTKTKDFVCNNCMEGFKNNVE